jgi:hypothetical protein
MSAFAAYAGLRFSPLLTINLSAGPPKAAFSRHFYAL